MQGDVAERERAEASRWGGCSMGGAYFGAGKRFPGPFLAVATFALKQLRSRSLQSEATARMWCVHVPMRGPGVWTNMNNTSTTIRVHAVDRAPRAGCVVVCVSGGRRD